jgi:hypothetical protein
MRANDVCPSYRGKVFVCAPGSDVDKVICLLDSENWQMSYMPGFNPKLF